MLAILLAALGLAAPAPDIGPSHAVLKQASPNWAWTPGKICTPQDPDFAEYRYPEHVPYCRRDVDRAKKLRVAARYGIPEADFPKYEFDHLIPVCAGGSSSEQNLWPQPHGAEEADGKDRLEAELCRGMRAGTVKQAEAVRKTYEWFGAGPP